MFPRVEKERQSARGNISWCRAFGKALNSSLGCIQCNYCRNNRNSNTPKSDTTDNNNVVETRVKTRSSDIVEEKRLEDENSVEMSIEESDPMKGMTMLERRLSQGEDGLA